MSLRSFCFALLVSAWVMTDCHTPIYGTFVNEFAYIQCIAHSIANKQNLRNTTNCHENYLEMCKIFRTFIGW